MFSLLIPRSDHVPFVELSWHHSLLQTITRGGAGTLTEYTEYNRIINRRSTVYTDIWIDPWKSSNIWKVQLRYDINGRTHKSDVWHHREYMGKYTRWSSTFLRWFLLAQLLLHPSSRTTYAVNWWA